MTYGSRKLVAGLLAALPCWTPALAGGPITLGAAPDSPLVAPVADWSGPYLGFALTTPRGGNAWASRELDLSLVPDGWDGSAVVLTLGHDWQRGKLTYGALLSVSNGDYSAAPTNAPFINCADCDTRVSDLITLRGRAGFVAGQTLFFASGGLAHANVTATNLFGLWVIGDTGMTGWTAGLGLERRLGENLSFTMSYDHVDLGTMDLPDYLPTGYTDIDLGIVQVGMNVRW